ncbi:RHS repeat-associated core domain-containing protein [Hafnia alvei]|uniref:RHS repeat-associated core domain-containing protein n=1 Tax=Hafnia alvei TaxID=569 RepID=UPI001034C6A5|nr:RHS repeat-associated core domain-containing protein [Hafnia alvei]TBM12765.1 RHS repeat-associated core domain-containing protein [Hafnia alvei]
MDRFAGACCQPEWTSHNYKHFPQKNKSWKDIIKSTKTGPVKYTHDVDIKNLEYDVFNTGNPVTNIVWKGKQQLWGKEEGRSQEGAPSCRLRFPGQYEDDESGLFYNRYRYYDGDTGQYVSPDPIGLFGGLNPYASNPLKYIDPQGLCKTDIDNSAHNAADYQKLKDYYTQYEKYGSGGVRGLDSGRYRFYDETKPPRTPGEMAGARLTREWDPSTGNKRTWYETIDHSGNVRSVAPKPVTHEKNHHIFDSNGDYQGRR